ncbi:MAG TPA: 30S ribosomal protein S2 [Opitutales bacterium]|nr:30S ribosomal protein S2 [Opitutales bacterium]
MNITIRDLLDAGVHFGHQRRRWNPRSKEFVYDHRHGVSVIDLEKTYAQLEKATEILEDFAASGKQILLVGTKRQAQEMIREAGLATQMPFSANRWMGGTLTNFETIKRSLAKYKKYLAQETEGELAKLPGKEEAMVRREMARMHRNFEGLLNLDELPGALFVIDIKHEAIAVQEARRLKIPVVALVDTNSDPTLVDYPIPGNDDAAKSIRIILDTVVEAIQAGIAQRESRRAAKGVAAAARSEIDKEAAEQFAEGGDEVQIDGEALSEVTGKIGAAEAKAVEPKEEAPAEEAPKVEEKPEPEVKAEEPAAEAEEKPAEAKEEPAEKEAVEEPAEVKAEDEPAAKESEEKEK